jgi:Ca2+-binding EF-hand superfamily protein
MTIATAVRRTAVADPNLDGEVTSAEAGRYYETRFRLLDGDRDGSIHREEFLRTAIVRAVQVGGSFTPPRTREFESIDLDGDGALTPEEFLRASLMKRTSSGAGEVGGPRAALFDAVDTDRDGALSKHEFMQAGARDFERSDADGDGKVTIWEFYGGTSL